jgi:hypothetical protein
MKKILTMLALIALPGALVGQTPDERIQAALQKATSHGVPVSLLEEKIAEGRAKGISMDRIAAAVERREAGLQQAQQALAQAGREASAPELSAAADALGAGVSEAVLAKLAETEKGERRAAAIAALTALVAGGVLPQEALDRVTAALAKSGDALANLPAQAAEAQANHGAPTTLGRPDGAGAQAKGPPSSIPAPGKPLEAGKPTTLPGKAQGKGRG